MAPRTAPQHLNRNDFASAPQCEVLIAWAGQPARCQGQADELPQLLYDMRRTKAALAAAKARGVVLAAGVVVLLLPMPTGQRRSLRTASGLQGAPPIWHRYSSNTEPRVPAAWGP
jgi:hypothetical protein